MAIYHFTAKVISRAAGSSALAAAAYRSASRLHDQRLDRHHDFSNKAGVIHSEVLLPDGAPEHLCDRERLWNEVEASEKRIDAQLAREIEFALPRELDQAEGIRLARDFVEREFVDCGMIADLNVHWDIGADGDRTHVLATPGLDRHAAYVALSRHRDSVDLHYGRDDFADRGSLTRTLSRERGKDMASDYAHQPAQVERRHRALSGLSGGKRTFADCRSNETS